MLLTEKKPGIGTTRCLLIRLGIMFLTIVFVNYSFAGKYLDDSAQQKVTISGTVSDSLGHPLAKVSVQEPGANGTTTNEAGYYSLTVSSSQATITFAYVGFQTRSIRLAGRTKLDVILRESTSALDQVVVVGYGTRKVSDLTGAVSVIDNKVLENRPVTNVMGALQGAAPGLVVTRSNGQPGAEGYSVNIRGFSSINGTNSPLVIVDGTEGQLTDLNPDDIASISVLKDAAATAIYGAKAASGVLIVTTKTGQSGKLSVNYTGIFTSKSYYGIPERLHSWQEAQLRDSADLNAGSASFSYSDQQIEWMKKDTGWVYNMGALNGPYYDLDQLDMLIRSSSPSQNHNISVSGGNEKTKYFASLGYYDEDGILKVGPDGAKRYNARLNLTTKFNDIFSLDAKLAYSEQRRETLTGNNSIGGIGGDYNLFYNIYALRNLYPIYLPNSDNTKYAYTGSGSAAYATLKDGGQTNINNRNFDGVFTFHADNIVKGLSLRGVYSPHMAQDNTDAFAKTIPLWAYDATGTTASISNYINPSNSASKSRITTTSHEVQLLGDYDKVIAQNHHIHLFGGYQYQYYKYDYINAKANGLISNDIASLNLMVDPTLGTMGDNVQTNAWISYIGRINYDYKDKYLLELTARNDASSRLAPGHQRQTFPGVSASWVLSKEPWFNKGLGAFNLFKIRGSWGTLGNSQLGQLYQNNYNYIATLVQGSVYTFNNSKNISIYQSGLPSPGLGWEKVTTSDVGLDMALLDNRLTASFDYFVRENNNMLIQAADLPAVLGVSPSTYNGAGMRTKGWELTLGWRDNRHDLQYYVNFNLSDNTNKVTRYNGNIVVSSGNNGVLLGYPINSFFGYKADGYFSTADQVQQSAFQDARTGPGDIRYINMNGDSLINQGTNTLDNHGDLVYLGNSSPRFNFGLNAGFSYKSFDFSFFLQGTGKRTVQIYAYQALPFMNSWRMPFKENLDYWTPSNLNAAFPRLYTGGTQNATFSSFWAGNAAYIRLKNIQLGYTLPAKLMEKIGISKARIFFTGENIWTATKLWYKYMDPENPSNSSFNYPFNKSYALGVNINF